MNAPALTCSAITKHFGSNAALSVARLNVAASSIHALVGENGAGKSTLINIISGLLRPDSGEVHVFGQAVRFRSPLDAVAAGIGTVHQHFLLAEALTVAENVALGVRGSPGGWFFKRGKGEDAVAQLAEQTGLKVDPRATVRDLPVGMRQRVEILKALSRGARILLLDEPTAVLAPPEVETLFQTLRKLRADGRTIMIVTHKLNEVFALASDVTVLRRGTTVFEGSLSGVTPATLAEKMIGREAPPQSFGAAVPAPADSSEPVLKLQNISLPGTLSVPDLELRAGEIVGIAGVEGNGQDELAGLIARGGAGGTMLLNGRSLQDLDVAERSSAGLAFIPADRQREGLVLEMTLTENLHLREPLCRPFPGVKVLDHGAMKSRAQEVLQTYGVVPPEPELPVGSLSGGNQQKVVVAREMSRAPKLILACNPTRGLDIGAAADVYARLVDAARKQNAAVLLISSDLDEVLLLSDRVGVLYRGKLEILGTRGISKDEVGRAMVGAEKSLLQQA